MCNYTFSHYECGDAAEDHVDAGTCSEFNRTGVHCDRDNPANKARINIRRHTREGICGKCLTTKREADEIAAMEREIAKAKAQSLREAQQSEEQMRRAEERMRRESLADYEKKKAAETARVERMSKEKYDLEMRQREEETLALTLSAEEERRRLKEQEDLERALRESMKMTHSPKTQYDLAVNPAKKDFDGASTGQHGLQSEKRTTTKSSSPPPPPPMPKQLSSSPVPKQISSIPSPPPMPKSIATPPSPPAMPPAPSPNPAVVKRTPSSPKAMETPRDWSLPLVGEQEYGHLKIGNRSQPIHPSQKLQTPTKPVQLSSGPSPEARLRGVIAPDLPTLRQAQGQMTPTDGSPRTNFRRPSGTRRISDTPVDPHVDPKLQEILAKRRQWEPVEEEEKTSTLSSITPSQSASNFGSPPRTPTSLSSGKPVVRADSPLEMTRDEGHLQAKRLSKLDFDAQRKAGWKQE